MKSEIRLFTIALLLSSIASGAVRFSGEKGARPHQSRIAAGLNYECALLDDGTVQCWGANDSGQLGDGTFTSRALPAPVTGLGPAIFLASGHLSSCVILSNSGAVRCWGDNRSGQLGNGAIGNSATPVPVTGMVNAISVAVGARHACAVRVDGSVWCWGDNSRGQLGNGSTVSGFLRPVQVANLTGATVVAAGDAHTCAVLSGGGVLCWGDNTRDQLADGPRSPFQLSRLPVPTKPLSASTGTGATDLTSKGEFTCARLSDGSASCWGGNESGQLGIGTVKDSPVPVRALLASPVVSMAAGLQHVCAMLVDGTISCWGDDALGQLGDRGPGFRTLPGPLVQGATSAVEIAPGADFTCAAISGGTIRCWGDNSTGQHGNGNRFPSGTDSVVGISGTFLGAGITAGNGFTCGRRGTGALACWGGVTQGQPNAASPSATSPVAAPAIDNAIGVSTGTGSHACAVTGQGATLCWGNNSNGQLGDGAILSTEHAVQTVTVINADGSPALFVAVSAGESHTCGLTATGLVSCWGANDRGQLGTGGAVESLTASPVPGVFNAVAIATGSRFSCALIVDGTVQCWGDNLSNQLGDGGVESFSPIAKTVPGLRFVAGITVGTNHACALTVFGTALCWGSNSRGQIGNNSTLPAQLPTTVQGLSDAVAISAGAFFTCAVQATGAAFCWGANDAGELGAKDGVDHLTPTPVVASVFSLPTGGTTFLALSGLAGISTATNAFTPTHEHACALLATGVIRCWGDNSQGEIGDGTTVNRARPTVVNSFAANVDPVVTLRNSRVAEVTALINCDPGGHAHIVLTLEQGAVMGDGQAEAACEGRLLRVPMIVPAHGLSDFLAGYASAQVEAIVRSNGSIIEHTHWIRQVTLSISRKE